MAAATDAAAARARLNLNRCMFRLSAPPLSHAIFDTAPASRFQPARAVADQANHLFGLNPSTAPQCRRCGSVALSVLAFRGDRKTGSAGASYNLFCHNEKIERRCHMRAFAEDGAVRATGRLPIGSR